MEIEEQIKDLMQGGRIDEAIAILTHRIESSPSPKANLYYLLGNAYRKQSNWQMALNNYAEAVALDPESPAAEAQKMILDLLEFYHKDYYNP